MLFIPLITKVQPLRIDGGDQIEFLLSHPTLDLLLPGNGRTDIHETLVVEQAVDVVLPRESGNELVLVLMHSTPMLLVTPVYSVPDLLVRI